MPQQYPDCECERRTGKVGLICGRADCSQVIDSCRKIAENLRDSIPKDLVDVLTSQETHFTLPDLNGKFPKTEPNT